MLHQAEVRGNVQARMNIVHQTSEACHLKRQSANKSIQVTLRAPDARR